MEESIRIAHPRSSQLGLQRSVTAPEMDLAPATFVVDPIDGGRFVYVSEALSRLFGRPREELLEQRLADWLPRAIAGQPHVFWERLRNAGFLAFPLEPLPGAQQDPLVVHLERFHCGEQEQVIGSIRCRRGGYPEATPATDHRPNGSPRPCDCEGGSSPAQPFRLSISSRADSCAIRQQLSLMELALDVVPDAVYLTDEHGYLRYANEAACRLRGYSREHFLTLHVSDIDPKLSRARWPNFQLRLEKAGSLTLETRHRNLNGQVIPVEINTRRFTYHDCGFVLFIARDIGDRKRLESQLRESERLHRSLLENFPDFIVRLDNQCRYSYVSPLVTAFWNRPKEPFLGRTACEIGLTGKAESDRAFVQNARKAIESRRPTRLELQVDSEPPTFLEIRHLPELGEDGNVISVLETARDITESRHRQRQEASRLSIFGAMALGAKLAEILNRVAHYIETLVPKTHVRIVVVADQGHRMVTGTAPGFPDALKSALAGLPVETGFGSCSAAIQSGHTAIAADIATHADWERCRGAALRAGFRSCWAEPVLGSCGQVLGAVDIYRRSIGKPHIEDLEAVRKACHLAAIAIDRHRLEQERDAREQQYRALADNAPAVIVRYDRDCRRVYFNKAFERFNGASAHQLLGRTPLESSVAVTPIADFYQQQLRDVLSNGNPVEMEKEWTLPDGTDICCILRFVPERNAAGQVTSVLTVSHDITARRATERALQTSERQFRSLVENSQDFIARYDSQGHRLYINPAMQRELGWSAETGLEIAPAEGALLDCPTAYLEALQLILQTGVPRCVEAGHRSATGQQRWCHFCFYPELDGDGRIAGVLAVGRDATELIRSREELTESRALLRDLRAQSEAAREEERKRLSRELHDELGQVLTSLRLNISLMRMRHSEHSPELDRSAAECIAVVDTAIRSVRRLASALRPLALDMGLAAAIRWQLEQFIGLTGVVGELNMTTEDLSPTENQSLLIFRVLQESLTNVARHAGANRVRVNLIRQDEIYVLTVSDDGRGFDMSAPPRNGALGILGMHERALAAGAVLTISSVPGTGTELVLSVPA